MILRLLTLLLGFSPFVAGEIFFRIVDWGRPEDHGDPFVGFREVLPLFVLNGEGTRYEIARGRQFFFRPDSFAAKKDPREFRIFCLGGSTVQGRPFSVETSFTTWLEMSLQAADPRRPFEVVNCGGISYASYRLVPILTEVLGHEPDLIVLYTGHNEFLEDRTYDHIKEMPWMISKPLELCSRLRTFVLLREGFLRLAGKSSSPPPEDLPILKTEVDARLDHRGALARYHRDEKWRRRVIDHYAFSLQRMVALCKKAGVPVLLLNPVCNLRDCPPFKSEHRDGLTAGELERWRSLREEARSKFGANPARSIQLFREALEIDGEHAALHFELARCLDSTGRIEEAREEYRLARELDICPLRILDAMNDAVVSTAGKSGTALVDIRGLFEELSDRGIPGNDWLLDHVHPSIRGHQKIAEALAGKMVDMGLLHPLEGWAERRDQRYKIHQASLDDFYFARGMQRLEAVRAWARGQVDE